MSQELSLKEAALEHAVAFCRAKPVGVGLMSMPDCSDLLPLLEKFGPALIEALLPMVPGASSVHKVGEMAVKTLRFLKDTGQLGVTP